MRESADPFLYVPWADGKIGFDCVECRAGCCRSGTIGMTSKENDFLAKEYPKLLPFIHSTKNPPGYVKYRKSQPSCWFLNSDYRCEIELDHGKERKPHVCRTHPVYFRPFLSRNVVIAKVGPGCVWSTENADEKVGQLTWKETEDLNRENMEFSLYGRGLDTPPSWDVDDLQLYLGGEEVMRDEWHRFSTVVEYLSWQYAYSQRLLRERQVCKEVSSEEFTSALSTIRGLENALANFLFDGNEIPQLKEEIPFLLFSPMLRLELSGILGGDSQVRPWLQDQMIADELFKSLPKVMLSLYMYTLAYSDVSGNSSHPYSFDTLFELASTFQARFFALSSFNDAFEFRQGPKKKLEVKDQAAMSGFVAMLNDGEFESFGNAINQYCSSYDKAKKLLFLGDVARLLPMLEFHDR